MSSDELSLTWDDHHNTLVKVFGKLLRTSSLVDCTIAAEGQYIKAHKILLSACSPYFELLFNQENEKNPIVVLKDVKFQELKAIIDFIYCGKVRVPEDRLGDFVDAAESLQIKGLGGDNYKTPSSGKISAKSERSESSHPPDHEFSVSSSPFRRKRRRPLSINEGNVSEKSSGTNVNDEYQSIERVPHGQMQEDRLSHQSGQQSSSASASNRLCSASVTVHSEQRIVDTDSPASFAEPSPPSPLEILPNPDTMVIKTEPEPEPIAEVLLPEMDFEPKDEEDVEDTIVLDSEGEVSGAVLNVDTQSSSSQYTDLPTALQTAAASSDDAFLRTDEVEHTRLQGAVETSARGGRRLPPATSMQPADATLGGVPVTAFRRRVAGSASVAAAVASAPSAVAPGSSSGTAGPSARKRHGCPVCGKAFSSPSDLARHLRLHTGDRPFKCEQCGKAFKQMQNMQTHKRIHSGERPFECEHCGKTFTQMIHLQTHKRIHSGERPFKCEQCGKAFSQITHLRIHMRMHTGERPYGCDECGVTTADSSNLREHKRRVHGAPPSAKRCGPRE